MIKLSSLKSFVLLCFFNYGESVPNDYCLHPLNRSDCGVKPTSVFSYYKPGSRCEIESWRGCPTFNKFPDEFLCSHHCIGKLYERTVDNDIMQLDFIDHEIEDKEYDECSLPMQDGDCGVQGKFKYTFVDYLCIRVAWRGCKSHNLFDDEASCIRTCKSSYKSQTISNFEEKLDALPFDDVEAINKILDNVLTNSIQPKIKKLLHKVTVEENTELEPTEPNTEAQMSTAGTKDEEVETESSTDASTVTTAVPTTVPIKLTDARTNTPVVTTKTSTMTTTSSITPTTDTTEAGKTETTVKPTEHIRETTTVNVDKDLTTTPEDSGSVDEVIVT